MKNEVLNYLLSNSNQHPLFEGLKRCCTLIGISSSELSDEQVTLSPDVFFSLTDCFSFYFFKTNHCACDTSADRKLISESFDKVLRHDMNFRHCIHCMVESKLFNEQNYVILKQIEQEKLEVFGRIWAILNDANLMSQSLFILISKHKNLFLLCSSCEYLERSEYGLENIQIDDMHELVELTNIHQIARRNCEEEECLRPIFERLASSTSAFTR